MKVSSRLGMQTMPPQLAAYMRSGTGGISSFEWDLTMDTIQTLKEEMFSLAETVFEGSGISVTKEGRRHLGAAIGSEAFKEEYV